MYALIGATPLILQGVVMHRQALEPNSELVNLKVITQEFPVHSSQNSQGNGHHLLLRPGV